VNVGALGTPVATFPVLVKRNVCATLATPHWTLPKSPVAGASGANVSIGFGAAADPVSVASDVIVAAVAVIVADRTPVAIAPGVNLTLNAQVSFGASVAPVHPLAPSTANSDELAPPSVMAIDEVRSVPMFCTVKRMSPLELPPTTVPKSWGVGVIVIAWGALLFVVVAELTSLVLHDEAAAAAHATLKTQTSCRPFTSCRRHMGRESPSHETIKTGCIVQERVSGTARFVRGGEESA
jgi:hypothetical protein